MAKKKGKKKDKNKKQQTNNCANNTNVNIEEKLVRAIELAKEIHDENKEPEKTLPKISFWKKVKYIITNKTDDGTISLAQTFHLHLRTRKRTSFARAAVNLGQLS